MCSLVFDIASHIVDDAGFLARVSEWLIGIGVLGAAAAAIVGFLDLIATPSDTIAHRVGLLHMTPNRHHRLHRQLRVATGDYRQHSPVGLGPVVLSVISIAGFGVSGYLGGRLAYRYGVRVARMCPNDRFRWPWLADTARSPCSQISGRPANTLGTTASSVDMLDSPTTPA